MGSRKVTAARIGQDAGATRYAAEIAETRAYLKNKRRGQADDLLQQLFCVCPLLRDCMPLAIGIHRQVREALSPPPSLRIVCAALRLHTRREAYLRALAADGSVRHSFDGVPVGSVSPEHREGAAVMLARQTTTSEGTGE